MRTVFIFSISLLFSACSYFAVGRYPFAEQYKTSVSKEDLINLINSFKKTYPEYSSTTFKDHDSESNDYWYLSYFNDDKNRRIFFSYVIEKQGKATLGLVSVMSKKRYFDWYQINKDLFSWKKDREIKDYFEKEILNKILAQKPVLSN